MLPLSGVRVLDLTRVVAGPLCSQILGDFGAEVIKVEEPRVGDPGRWQPPTIEGEGPLFFQVNRNKKSLAVDLKKEAGQQIFRRLVKSSDVVMEQFRPGVMDKLGLGYQDLRRINPRIVYCSLSGYGQTGPLSREPGHDLNFQSIAGIAGLYGGKGQEPSLPPVTFAVLAGGGLYAAVAILLGLLYREKTGEGQYCDISMTDGAISLLVQVLAEWAGWDRPPRRGEEVMSGCYAFYNTYKTRDGSYVTLGAVEFSFWKKFCDLIGREDFIYQQWEPDRQEEMKKIIQDIISQKDRQEWLELLGNQQICFTPMLNLEEMCQHPQIIARKMIHRLENFKGSGRDLFLTGQAIKMPGLSLDNGLTFPGLGEHNQQILSWLGYSEQEIAELQADEVL